MDKRKKQKEEKLSEMEDEESKENRCKEIVITLQIKNGWSRDTRVTVGMVSNGK